MESKKLSIRETIAITCTLLSVIASLRSIYVSNESLKLSTEGIRVSTESLKLAKASKEEERLGQKPSLAMTLSQVGKNPTDPKKVCFTITLQNVGHRNAYDLRTVSYLMKRGKHGHLVKVGSSIVSSSSELGVGTFTTSRYPVTHPLEVQYLVTMVTYQDSLLRKKFTQKFVRRWYEHELVIPKISEQNQVIAFADQMKSSSAFKY